MKCQNCGCDVPEGKIYCEHCGTAIQMVPDYNPADDISIGEVEKKDVLKSEINQTEDTQESEDDRESADKNHKWKYAAAGILLAVLGGTGFYTAYRFMTAPEETVAEPEEEIVLLEKPEFSVLPGIYDYVLRLTISHNQRNEGQIYYTTDGTTPDAGSKLYNTPILIDEGTTVIRAIFIRSDGIQSEEADGTYEVIFDYPDEPDFSVESGDYAGGFYVTITSDDDDCKIYYTTNGEEPGPESRLYREPIYVSPGLTVLQAVAIDDDGGMSGITEAIYNVSEISVPPATAPDQVP